MLKKLGTEENFFNLVRALAKTNKQTKKKKNTPVTIILSGERLKTFLQDLEQDKISSRHFYSTLHWKFW